MTAADDYYGDYMTVEDVEARVEEIRKMAADYEKAHNMEDDLYEAVLRCLAAEGIMGIHASELSQAALKTKDIDFPRFCA